MNNLWLNSDQVQAKGKKIQYKGSKEPPFRISISPIQEHSSFKRNIIHKGTNMVLRGLINPTNPPSLFHASYLWNTSNLTVHRKKTEHERYTGGSRQCSLLHSCQRREQTRNLMYIQSMTLKCVRTVL